MVGRKQLEKLGYEAEEYTEIFRQFRQWYQSQRDFDAIESHYWFGCIKLAKEKNLSIGNLFDLILGKLHSSDVDADGTERCVFSVLAAYLFTQPEILLQSKYIQKHMAEQKKIQSDEETNISEEVLTDPYQESEIKKEPFHEVPTQSPKKSNLLMGFFLRKKNKQQKKEEQKIREVFEKKLLDLSSEQIDFISKKMEEGYDERDLLVLMEPALAVEKMGAICRLLKTKE